MNQLPESVGSTQTSKSTVTLSRPASRLLGSATALPLLLEPPEKVKPSPAFQLAVPVTVPSRPLPDESAATVPLVSSSFHHPTRSLVRSPSTAPAEGSVAVAAPPRTTAIVVIAARNLRMPRVCELVTVVLLGSVLIGCSCGPCDLLTCPSRPSPRRRRSIRRTLRHRRTTRRASASRPRACGSAPSARPGRRRASRAPAPSLRRAASPHPSECRPSRRPAPGSAPPG